VKTNENSTVGIWVDAKAVKMKSLNFKMKGKVKMLKRIFSLFLIIAITITLLTTAITVNANSARYIVLVLDESGRSTFTWGKERELIYTADSAVDYVKSAAKNFIADTLQNNSNQYISVVSYHKDAKIQCNFTNDANQLSSAIDNLYAHAENLTNLTLGTKTISEKTLMKFLISF